MLVDVTSAITVIHDSVVEFDRVGKNFLISGVFNSRMSLFVRLAASYLFGKGKSPI